MGLREDIIERCVPIKSEQTVGVLLPLLMRSIVVNMDIAKADNVVDAGNLWAVDCAKDGILLPMPGECCFFTGRLFRITNCPPGDRRQGMLAHIKDGGVFICVLGIERMDDGRFGVTVTPEVTLFINDRGVLQWKVEASSRAWGNDDEKTIENAAIGVGAKYMTCVGLMSLKLASIVTAPPPEKLNKARVRSGKQALSEVVTVRIKDWKKGDQLGGQHASPRPHWRRGHVRRISDGKVVLVTPHAVMGGVDLAKRYEVKN